MAALKQRWALGVFAALLPALLARAATPDAALISRMTLEEKATQLQNISPAISRLGIPAYPWWNEALHGVVGDLWATNYPEPIGLAASFDAPMLRQIAASLALELRALRAQKIAAGRVFEFGAGLDVWAPNINIFRDPRWGRGQETYGEDPFLTATMGVAYVKGLQGPNPAAPLAIATPKHFAVHSGPESTRHTANVEVSLHDLRDTYLPAFRAALVEGHAGSVMCAYNSINGQPACANDFLLKDTLRGAWHFKGYVVSDCEAVNDINGGHRFAADAASAAAVSLRAGMDNECTVGSFVGLTPAQLAAKYVEAVKRGLLEEGDLDRALLRLLAARRRVGDLPRASAPQPGPSAIGSPAHRALALRAAESSMVLLRNDGILPLKSGALHIALVGPLADAHKALRGNYSSRDTADVASVYDGLRRALPQARVTLVPFGPSITDSDLVPSSALRTGDAGPGVTVRYFPRLPAAAAAKAMQVSDVPSATRVESHVSVEYIGANPYLPQGGLAVTTGELVPALTGTYRLAVAGVSNTLNLDGEVISRSGPESEAGLPDYVTRHLEGGRAYPFTLTAQVDGIYKSELLWKRISVTPVADAVAAARDADVVVAAVGITSQLEGEESPIDVPGFKGGDRTSLELPSDQRELLEALAQTGKPLVLVNFSGSAVNLAWAKDHANAILQAWYPGEEGGIAVGRILSGATNPAARLPVTFYRDVGDLPAFEDYSMSARTYRYFEGKPVYAFGYGLSYTSFAYSPLRLQAAGASAADGLHVRTTVRNTGSRAGDEVAQLYLGFPAAPGAPRIALRGFKRVHLLPGEQRVLDFRLTPRDLSSVSPEGATRVLAGAYEVHVGGAQPGGGLPSVSGRFTVPSAVSLPD